MKKRLFKKTLPLTLLAVPALVLSSCSSTFSQYGINSEVKSNYQDANEKYAKTFGGFKFNNTSISSNSTLVDSDDYSKLGWNGVLVPLSIYLTGLINLNLLENKSTIDPNNSIFESNDNNLLNEFYYATRNVLNSGRRGQIKFGIIGLETKFNQASTPAAPNSKSIAKQTNKATSVYAAVGTDLTVGTKQNEDAKTAYYETDVSFTFSATLGYWYSDSNKPDQKPIKASEVEKYVVNNKSWPSEIKPTYSTFNIEFKYSMKLRATYYAIAESFKAAKPENGNESTPKKDNSSNTDENKPSIDTVKLVEADKDIKPVFTINSYTKKDSSNSSLPELTPEKVNEDLSAISKQVSSTIKDKNEIEKLLTKYKNFLKITGTK